MLLDFRQAIKRHRVTPTGLLHIGAHRAEELRTYRHIDSAMPVWWVEANPDLIPKLTTDLRRWPNNHVVHSAVGSTDCDVTLNVANNSQSSSLLPLGTHAQVHPEVHYTRAVTVPCRTIDSLVAEHGIEANVLVMDIQGGEGAALQGADRFLAGVRLVYAEVNAKELYKGCWLLPEMDSWLGFRGFELRELCMEGATGWGDGLWVSA